MTCKNCGHHFEGNFCNQCGQSASVKRVDAASLLEEFMSKVLQLEHGFLFTVKALTLAPGHSIKAYLEGKRKPFFKPLAYLLLLSALYALMAYWFGQVTYIDDIIDGIVMGGTARGRDKDVLDTLQHLSGNFTYFNLLLLPIFVASTTVLFRKAGYNFYEHFILNTYLSAHLMWGHIAIGLFFYLFVEDVYYLQLVPFVIGFSYFAWAFSQFFDGIKPVIIVILLIIAYLLYLLGLLMILALVFSVFL